MEKNSRKLYTKVIWYLVIATITLLLINVFSIARFSSKTESSMNIDIAKPIIVLNSETSEITDLSSEEQEISFSVKNFSNGECSDIKFNYQLKFETEDEIPIIFSLYKIDGESKTECIVNDNNVSEWFSIPHSIETIDNYVLSVKIDDAQFQGMSTQMKIIIYANQAI